MLEHMLHLSPAQPDERPQAPRTQADKWATNLAAARQFHTREIDLHVPRKHVETVDGVEHNPGTFLDNARRAGGSRGSIRTGRLCRKSRGNGERAPTLRC
jgi:hypothetical protein